MTLRLHTFLAGLLALLMAALLALAPVAAKPASGGYQLFEGVASGDQHAISLASLENFNYHAKIAPECCNATKGTGGVLVGDSHVPSGSDVVRNGTIRLDRTITTKTGRKIPAGSVVTENGGAIKIFTPDGRTITDKTDSLLGSQQLKLPPPATKGTVVDVSNVKKGTPEYEALNNPKPNTTTELSNGTAFKTGAGGYVDEITYRPVDSPGIRDSRQTAVGKEGIAGDVGGHAQSCRHGGTCDRFNLFPQNSNFNNGAYKRWENKITRSLKKGDDVGDVTLRFNRADPHNPRPDSLEIEYQINGRTYTREFENRHGG